MVKIAEEYENRLETDRERSIMEMRLQQVANRRGKLESGKISHASIKGMRKG